MKVAILGVGHLMYHVVPGMLSNRSSDLEIRLSARSQSNAQDLAQRYGLQIVEDNQQLVDWAGVVIVAVRPFDVATVLGALTFKDGQTLMSFAATVSVADLQSLAPKCEIVLGMPNVAAEYKASTTVIHPANETASKLMAACGEVIAVDTEAEYETASLFGAYYGWLQALTADMSIWAQTKGLSAETARSLIAGVTRSSATRMLMDENVSVEQLVEDLSLPGSLTGQGVGILRSQNAFAPWRSACEQVLARIQATEQSTESD